MTETTNKNVETCDFCGSPATSKEHLLSGEPISICESGDCHDQCEALADREEDEMRSAGFLPPLARDA